MSMKAARINLELSKRSLFLRGPGVSTASQVLVLVVCYCLLKKKKQKVRQGQNNLVKSSNFGPGGN